MPSGPATSAAIPNDLESYWIPFTPNRAFKAAPRLIARAKDMHYYTPDGRAVLDGTAGLWCTNAGHNRDPIVAAISAGPRSASPRGRRARSFWGFFGFSAMGGVGTSAGAMRQPGLLLPLPLFAGEGWGGGDAGPGACGFPPPPALPRRREREQ